MKDETFVSKVEKIFSFLKINFKFKLILKKNSDTRPQTDGIVKYASDTTLLIIDSETGQVSVRFARIQDDESYYLDPVLIHEYLNTSEEEKKILLSRKKENQEVASTIFRKKFLLGSPNWRSSGDGINIDLEKRLTNYASWLKENADICLRGNFSQWPKLYEYKINRLIADELRRGAKDTVLSVIKDENGSLKTIKRPIFQKDIEHLVKLRRDVLNN